MWPSSSSSEKIFRPLCTSTMQFDALSSERLQPIFARCCANNLLGTLCPESTEQRYPAWACPVLLKSTFTSAVMDHRSVQSHLDACYMAFPSIRTAGIAWWYRHITSSTLMQGSRKALHWSNAPSQWHLKRSYNQSCKDELFVDCRKNINM